jgi:hypothetical protein
MYIIVGLDETQANSKGEEITDIDLFAKPEKGLS